MPHTLSSSPFVSLQHDASCGRSNSESETNATQNGVSFSSLSNLSNTQTNRIDASVANPAIVHVEGSEGRDEFLKLAQPQQDVLLLHGPGKRYSLERQKEIPALKNDREILVQVLAIGLNPVDWKGPDYGEL